MAELIAKTPCAGLLPARIGACTLSEEKPGTLTLLAPARGQQDAMAQALVDAHAIPWPDPNRATGQPGARAVWFGQGQVMLMGPVPGTALAAQGAVCDQSDAWAVVRLEGAGAADVLARLVPVDLRASVFEPGHTARSDLMHMMASITRLEDGAFQIMVFRSMAVTLVHDLKTAMEAVAARG